MRVTSRSRPSGLVRCALRCIAAWKVPCASSSSVMRINDSSTVACAAFQTSSKEAWKSFCWRRVGSGSTGSGLGRQDASKKAKQSRYGTRSILDEQHLGALEGWGGVAGHPVLRLLRQLRLDRLDALVRERMTRHQALEQHGLDAALVLDVLEHRDHGVRVVTCRFHQLQTEMIGLALHRAVVAEHAKNEAESRALHGDRRDSAADRRKSHHQNEL